MEAYYYVVVNLQLQMLVLRKLCHVLMEQIYLHSLLQDVDLTYYVYVKAFQILLVGDILLHLFVGHSDAVIRNFQRARVFIRNKIDVEIASGQTADVIDQGFIIQFIDRVAAIADQFAQKHFLVRVDRIDHHVQNFFGFCLKLLHKNHLQNFRC